MNFKLFKSWNIWTRDPKIGKDWYPISRGVFLVCWWIDPQHYMFTVPQHSYFWLSIWYQNFKHPKYEMYSLPQRGKWWYGVHFGFNFFDIKKTDLHIANIADKSIPTAEYYRDKFISTKDRPARWMR
jgi:hypothetical protein